MQNALRSIAQFVQQPQILKVSTSVEVEFSNEIIRIFIPKSLSNPRVAFNVLCNNKSMSSFLKTKKAMLSRETDLLID
jgi:hypothetical protein